MAATASAHKTVEYTQPHGRSGCRQAFYPKASWNRVTVRCLRRGRDN